LPAAAIHGSYREEQAIMLRKTPKDSFYGWRVVSAAFVLAVFGLGIGFYGPPIFLKAVQETRDWSLLLVSAAVTTHFLTGAVVTAKLPTLYARWGLANVTRFGAIAMALGVIGWAVACQPWHLFMAAALSGAGWVTMGVAAINAIVSPWFIRQRRLPLLIMARTLEASFSHHFGLRALPCADSP
jgi:hypothetical protein